MSDFGLVRFNRMTMPESLKVLSACSGSSSWCYGIAAGRPYPNRSELLHFADLKFRSLTKVEWMEAFAHHIPLQEKLANDESFSAEERLDLDDSCRRYFRRFGYGAIMRTDDLQPKQILAQLHRRLRYDVYDELSVAGQQQALITKDKLVVGLDELGQDVKALPDTRVRIIEGGDAAYLKARGNSVRPQEDLAKKSA